MKKNIFLFGLFPCLLALFGCSSKEDVDMRETYVGVYSLNVISDVSMTNGSKTVKYPMDATNKKIVITLNTDDKSKVNYSGYYGEGTATLIDNTLQFDEPRITATDYYQGIYIQINFDCLPISKSGNNLVWNTAVVGGAVSIDGKTSNAVAISGILYNTASKQ